MHAEERRETILKLLRQSATPVRASTLAGQLSVSRQIIVGDIALLRAGGADILATPRGYCLQNAAAAGLTRRVAVRHDALEAERFRLRRNGVGVQHAGINQHIRFLMEEFFEKLPVFFNLFGKFLR